MGREVRRVRPNWKHPRDKGGNYIPRNYTKSLYGPEEKRTHFMMYEDTSEGTPISPAFASPEELARWLADNGASAFAGMTATYDQWLRVCQGGFAPSMVIENGRMLSGVEALADDDPHA